jgi:hypothetical protein
MSTSEPGESPSFAPPQDPWSGSQGIASAPTDPFPAPEFAQGVASPVAPSVWSQETVAHNDPYGHQPRKSGFERYVVEAVVAIVAGVGGYAAWYVTSKNYHPQPGAQSTNGPSGSASASTSPSVPATFDPASVQVNDCMASYMVGNERFFKLVTCATGQLKVIKIAHGADIPKNAKGDFDDDSTGTPVCAGTGYSDWFGWNSTDNTQDYVWCLKKIS